MKKNCLLLITVFVFLFYNSKAQNETSSSGYLLSKVIQKNRYTENMDTTSFTYNNKNQLIKCATSQTVYDNFIYNPAGQVISFKRADAILGNKKVAIKCTYANNNFKVVCSSGEFVSEEYTLLNNNISKGTGVNWFRDNISYTYNEQGNITKAIAYEDFDRDTALYTYDKNYLNPYKMIGKYVWVLLSSSPDNVIKSESKNIVVSSIKNSNHLNMEDEWTLTKQVLFKASVTEAAEENKALPKAVKYIYDDGVESIAWFYYTKAL